MEHLKIGLIQMAVKKSKEENLTRAKEEIQRAVALGAEVVVLPEMFNCPYEAKNFPLYAEPAGGESWRYLSQLAERHSIYLIGGSMPEVDGEGKVYNTSYIFGPDGEELGKHRKMHLFDIDVAGGQTFKESDTLTPGQQVTVVETRFGKMGIMICYDLRFPELARLMVQQGARLIIVPGAFNMTTGPVHWELLFRTRALDNQVYMVGVAPARDQTSSYISYANSLITNPWGEVVCRLGENEEVWVQELDLTMIDKTRQELPILKHRRLDLYHLGERKNRESRATVE